MSRFCFTVVHSLLLVVAVFSFAPIRMKGRLHQPLFMSTSENNDLTRFTTPSQTEAEAMGIREWPQQAKSRGSFEEVALEGKTLIRYVLDGEANVIVKKNTQTEEKFAMRPGSLLEVRGEAKLSWQVETEEMILLTPGFEQLGLFAGVVIGLIMVMGTLIASS